ncbi:MAG: 50S ribosomal protein L10 [Acidobacteria bacterium]|nr:50S ribosomal protein L10 [Acidobacteriota bacterium]MCH8986159.1 50S ribosomal protein L10 [Acidobacteriota bacterium]
MPRPDKVKAVAELQERFEGAQAVFLAEYAGLSVKSQQELRRGLRESGAEFKVAKMTLTRLATAGLDIEGLEDLLVGPTGLAFADADPAAAAKVLATFAAENDAFTIKGAVLGVELLTPERVADLAKLPSRDELLAKLLGTMRAPMSNMAGLLAALPRNVASMMQQLIEKKEAAGDTTGAVDEPAEPVAADDSAVDEAVDDDTSSELSADDTVADEAAGSDTADDDAVANETADVASENVSQEQEEPADKAEEE